MQKRKRDGIRGTIYIFLCTFIFLVSSCSDSVDLITYDPPVSEIEEQVELLIEITDAEGNELTGYNIAISGPVNASASNVGESSYRFTNFRDGEYQITVSKDGFDQEQIVYEAELPGAAGQSYYDEISISIQELAPPVPVSNSDGGTITAGGTAVGDDTTEPVATISFSPGTFPGGLEDEDGNVQVSVTRVVSNQDNNIYDGSSSESIVFLPDNTDLNVEAEIELPIAVPNQESANVSGGAEALQFVLQPGNIPLTPVANSNELEQSGKVFSESMFLGRRAFRSSISRFQRYRIVPNRRVTRSRTSSDFSRVAGSACGEPLILNRTIASGEAGPLATAYSAITRKFSNRNYRLSREIAGVAGTRITVEEQHRIITFTVTNTATGTVLEESSVKAGPFFLRISRSNCHDSGGS